MSLMKILTDNKEVIKKGLIIIGGALAGAAIYALTTNRGELSEINESNEVEINEDEYEVVEEPVVEDIKRDEA